MIFQPTVTAPLTSDNANQHWAMMGVDTMSLHTTHSNACFVLFMKGYEPLNGGHTPWNCIQFLVDVWSFKASCWTEIDALHFHPVSNQSLLSPGQKCISKTRVLPWYIHDQATTVCAQIKVAFYFLEANHWYMHSPLHFHCRCCKQNGGEFLDESKLNLNILGLQFTEKKISDEGSR